MNAPAPIAPVTFDAETAGYQRFIGQMRKFWSGPLYRHMRDEAASLPQGETYGEALRALRTSSRPMFLVTQPNTPQLDDLGAHALGKAWNKLDEMALELGLEPLSTYIALPGEDDSAAVLAHHMLPTLTALINALQVKGRKFPSKRTIVPVLTEIHGVLQRLGEQGGRASFAVDL